MGNKSGYSTIDPDEVDMPRTSYFAARDLERIEVETLAELIHDSHCDCKMKGPLGAGHPGAMDLKAAMIAFNWYHTNAKIDTLHGKGAAKLIDEAIANGYFN